MLRGIAGVAVLATVTWGMAAQGAETIDSIEARLAAQASKCKSLQCTGRVVEEMREVGTSVRTVTDTRFEILRKGDKTLSRTESAVKRTIQAEGEPERTETGTTLTVCDGQFIHVFTHVEDQKTITKSKVDPSTEGSPIDPVDMFRQMRKQYTLKLLPSATVDGRETWVVEARAGKSGKETVSGRVETFYDKKTGLPLKQVVYDDGGKVFQTATISDIKINGDIPAERFMFKAPPGVPVLDMTRLESGNPPASDAAGEPISPELPDE